MQTDQTGQLNVPRIKIHITWSQKRQILQVARYEEKYNDVVHNNSTDVSTFFWLAFRKIAIWPKRSPTKRRIILECRQDIVVTSNRAQ